MSQVPAVFLVIILGGAGTLLARSAFEQHLHRWIAFGFVAHVLSAFAQVLISFNVYGGGDLRGYYMQGGRLAEKLSEDFFWYAPKLVQIMNGHPTSLAVFGTGSSTGSMIAISAFVLFFTLGSLYAACLAVSMWSFSGQLAILYVMCKSFPRELHQRLAIAALLVPSVVFWSSGLLKEGPAMGAIGWLVLGAYFLVHWRKPLLGFVLVAIGAYIIGMVKSYVLFPAFIAIGVWVFWHRAATARRVTAVISRPIYLVLGGLAVAGAIAGLSAAFPRFALNNLADETARLQELYAYQGGGSTYVLGDPSDRSLSGQMAFAPLAMVSSLLRPFIFEVHNATSFINAVEMLLILLAWIQIIRRRKFGALTAIARSPFLVFCAVYVLPFALAVGLAAPNLGSLSRYRIPMMPFYVCILVVLAPWTRWEKKPG